MHDPIHIARDNILAPVGLENRDIDRLLGQLSSPSIDAADIYFQSSRLQSWVLEDGIIKEGSFSIEQGPGCGPSAARKRVSPTPTSWSCPPSAGGQAARAIARGGAEGSVQVPGLPAARRLYEPLNPLQSLPDDEKGSLLHRVDAGGSAQDPRIKQVITSLVAAHDVVLVVSDDGTLSGDVRPLVRLSVIRHRRGRGKREQGTSGGGARAGPWLFPGADRCRSTPARRPVSP